MVRIDASQDEGYPDTVHGCYSTPINCLSKRRTFAKKRAYDDDSRSGKKNKKKMSNRNAVIAVNNMISSQGATSAATTVSSPVLLDTQLSDFQFRVNTVMSTLSNKIDMLIDTINGQRVEIRDLKCELQSLRVNGATNNTSNRAVEFAESSKQGDGGDTSESGFDLRKTLTDTGRLNSLTQLLASGMEALGNGGGLNNTKSNNNSMSFSSLPRPQTGAIVNNYERDDFSYLRNNKDSNHFDVQDDINNANPVEAVDLDNLEQFLMNSDHPAKDEFKREYEKGGRNGLFRFVSEDYERLKSLAPSTPDLLRVLSTNSIFNCYNKYSDTTSNTEDWSGGGSTRGARQQHSNSSNNPLHILTTTAAM
jgi:FtsZ-binding cell division protein ZapB